jgi:LmbE family N-acetylglucosaminyl deacetylase
VSQLKLKKVVVATVFTKSTEPEGATNTFAKSFAEGEGDDVIQGRRREDTAALSALGVTDVIHLGYLDAPFRHSLYKNGAAVVTREHPDDRVFSQELSTHVASLYEKLAPQTVFVPWAVGEHIDHRLTHRMWQALPASADVVFYEDRPYSFVPYNLALRLKELGATALGQQAKKRCGSTPSRP